ncbi:MAG: hypothetical protein Q8862_11095 [Bacteroidota bacterium]|nr:hypothetical protein [Bacteroidota bacterium]
MQQNNSWENLCSKLSEDFGVETNLNGVLFLIGVRERGYLLRPFTKEEKIDLINLGCCKLFSYNNLCQYKGDDKQGWPVWIKQPALDSFSEEEKVSILKEAAFNYFNEIDM